MNTPRPEGAVLVSKRHPDPDLVAKRGFVFWGSDCILPGGCDGNATYGTMRCDECETDEFTIPLYSPKGAT